MKGTRFPLWLICDAGAAIRLALATWLLSYCVRRYWPKNARKPPAPAGVASMSLALSCAEALLRWVITRQALRSCGLDPRMARLFQLPQAASSFTWQARCRTFLRLVENMTLYARRWARRIKSAMTAKPAAAPAPHVVSLFSSTFFIFARFSVFAPAAAVVPAGQRIRAPPWLCASPKTLRPRLAGHRRGRGRLCVSCCPTPGV